MKTPNKFCHRSDQCKGNKHGTEWRTSIYKSKVWLLIACFQSQLSTEQKYDEQCWHQLPWDTPLCAVSRMWTYARHSSLGWAFKTIDPEVPWEFPAEVWILPAACRGLPLDNRTDAGLACLVHILLVVCLDNMRLVIPCFNQQKFFIYWHVHAFISQMTHWPVWHSLQNMRVMPFWGKKVAEVGVLSVGQSCIPSWPCTSIWDSAAQVLNWGTPPMSWESEMVDKMGASGQQKWYGHCWSY